MENLNSLNLQEKEVRKMKGVKKGFTLIELIAVIAIIGILAAIIVPNIMHYTKNAKKAKAIDDAKTVVAAIDAWNAEQDGSSAAIATNVDLSSGAASSVIGDGKSIKSFPTEFKDHANTYADLQVVEESKYFDDSVNSTPSSGPKWGVDNGGIVYDHQ